MKRILAILLLMAMLLGVAGLFACSENSFTVIFDGNGGKQAQGDVSNLIQTVTSARELVEPKFERAGYEFVGWDVDLQGIKADATVKAEWKKNEYTISFDVNGGAWADGYSDGFNIKVRFGEKIDGEFPTVTKSGYKFEKWTIIDDGELNGSYFSPHSEYQHEKDIKIQAQWIELERVTINYVDAPFEAGVNPITSFKRTDEKFSLTAPNKIGYQFVGWTGEGITTPQLSVEINPAEILEQVEQLSYTANWQAKKYTVMLNASGGNCEKQSVEVEYGKPIILPTPTWDYRFLGWKRNGETINSGDVWTLDLEQVTLVAEWFMELKIKVELKYTIEKINQDILFSLEKTEGLTIMVGSKFTKDTIGTPTIISETEFAMGGSLGQKFGFSHWAYKNANGEFVKIEQDGTVATLEMVQDGVVTVYPICEVVDIWVYAPV